MQTAILDHILTASSRSDLFGADADANKVEYRRLLRGSHPDMFTEPRHKEKAQKAFVRLTELWNGSATPKPAASPHLKTKKHEYVLGDKFHEDDVFNAYNATYDAGYEKCELWIAKNAQDSDIARNAGMNLKKLNKDVPERYRAFFPELVEAFKYRQDGIDHGVIAQKIPEGFYSLSQVHKAYPNGISGRDVAWMFKRMLVAIGNAHDAGLVHGGISDEAFIIHPQFHGLMLRNWQYSVETDEALTAIDPSVRDLYPASVFAKEPQDYRLDVRMAALTAQKLLEDKAPRQLRIFFSGCLVSSVPHPSVLLKEFDDLLLRVYGEPKFNEFKMPF